MHTQCGAKTEKENKVKEKRTDRKEKKTVCTDDGSNPETVYLATHIYSTN